MIVITTPTGQIGGQVLDGLLARDAGPIRVVVRDPSRLAPGVRERVELVAGSHGDAAVLAEAAEGAGAVFWLVPPDPHVEDVEKYYLDFTRPLCDAVERHGVRRVVAVSTLGRGVAKDAGHISAALAMDELIEGTGVGYRALAAPGFMENVLRQAGPIRDEGVYYGPVPGGLAMPTCATRDIAAAAVGLLADDGWSGQEYVPILGPEDLSADDQARIMSEVLGRPVRYRQTPGGEAYRAALVAQGMSEGSARGMADMLGAVAAGLYGMEPRTAESSTPTSFRRWCEEVLKPAVG